MKTKILLLTFLLLIGITGFAVTKTIATTGGNTFSPPNLVINPGDVVQFIIGAGHNVLEVSQATYQTNGSAPLAGGFQFGFGPSTETLENLTEGIHYYICQAHISSGMKGTITVGALGVNDYQLSSTISFYPNPTTGLFTVKSNDNIFGSSYRIVDQSGRQVLAGEVNEVSTVDISSLNSGIYFFQFGEERKQTFKILKE